MSSTGKCNCRQGDFVIVVDYRQIPTHWIHENSYKTPDTPSYFEPFNLAPSDLSEMKDDTFTKGCWITSYCGIGLTPLGYFPCAVAGGIERIFKLGGGLENLPLDHSSLMEQMPIYCRYCGHYLKDEYQSRNERDIGVIDLVSSSWKEAYRRWHAESQDA